jgi:8-oxo-dGTP pyrophosphatase MutT (NUDIX family)
VARRVNGNGKVPMSGKPDWMISHGRPWQAGPARLIYDNPWLSLTEYPAVAPTGADALYAVVGFKNVAVAVLPLHDDGTIVMVGQNRFPLRGYSWEIPEGGAPLSEDPLSGAKRELAEETGLQAAEWRQVLKLQLSNSVTDERAVGFVATGLSPAPARAPDDTEDLATARVPFAQALRLATEGEIQDSLTVAMLLRAHHMAVSGELPRQLAQIMLQEPLKAAKEP